MTEDTRATRLAQRSPNFGYLMPYGTRLVTYGAGAEGYIFTDPNTALVKSRQFVESLTAELVGRLGLISTGKLATDIAVLNLAFKHDARTVLED